MLFRVHILSRASGLSIFGDWKAQHVGKILQGMISISLSVSNGVLETNIRTIVIDAILLELMFIQSRPIGPGH